MINSEFVSKNADLKWIWEKDMKSSQNPTNKSLQKKHIMRSIMLGLVVHILILRAVFDIYFASPIDHGMTPIRSTRSPPADRLVIVVADGLRAEAIFDRTNNTPNLNGIRKTRGSWGVARTRVPTESRPGHVALLAGIYEDPASILKGWKVNPVDFDSVINQSVNAWCWGAPSIVNMFNKDNLPHIHLHSYDPKMEDFGKNDTLSLDLWVFNEVQQFLDDRMQCTGCEDFYQKGNVFFLHLLGIDTAGHAYKPTSKEYHDNIKFVDNNMAQIENMFEKAFPDGRTVYVFTSDHGMTDWGSHGAGSDHETQIPIIVWGSGVAVEDKQKDVEQVDIAPLLSALIGIHYPINSLGKLPYIYLSSSDETINEMILSNVLQLTETFNIKKNRILKNAYRFVLFQGLSTSNIDAKISYFKDLLDTNRSDLFRIESENFMRFLIKGIDYYHNYYQLPILISTTVGFVAWIIFIGTFNVTTTIRVDLKKLRLIEYLFFAPLFLLVTFLLKTQDLPVMYYVYFLFPVVMLYVLTRGYPCIIETLNRLKEYKFSNVVINFSMYGFGLGALVLVFHNRIVLTPVLLVMAGSVFYIRSTSTMVVKLVWSTSCFALSLFPHFPTMKTSFNLPLYLAGYIAWLLAFHFYSARQLIPHPRNKFIFWQMKFLKLTPIYTLAVEYNVITSDSLIKYFSWIWAIVPMFMIVLAPTEPLARITSIFSGFGTFYLMVTSNYENLFLVCYVVALNFWINVENLKLQKNELREKLQRADDYRRAFFFVVFIFVGFFGTGNIASLNSFDPMWVRCFLTVFQPFKMTALILLRITVPFIYTSCVYYCINRMRRGKAMAMFCIVLMYSDIILLELMYYITNVGSWLEIGMSLSHFMIMEGFVIILLILYGLAHILTKSEI